MSLIETQSSPFGKFTPADAAASSFPSRIPQRATPGGIDMGFGPGFIGASSQNLILVLPYATAADNDTFSIRIIGWRRVGSNELTWLWIPVVLAEFACTCCAATGISGAEIAGTERFCDTITLTTGNDDVSIDFVSPTGDAIAHAVVDTKGFQKIEPTFKVTSGPTAMNALVSAY